MQWWSGSTATVLAVCATLGTARAQDLCSDIDDMIDQSRVQFADVTAESDDVSGDLVATRLLADASYCRVTASSQDSAYYCAWAFPYRAEDASETYDRLANDIADCLGGGANVQSGQGVNHPDTYDVRRFQTDRAVVNVALKDKVSLDATYVFVRIHGRQDD